MVGRFHISGGEPQLYPDLAELILYIHNNYSSKIETLAVVKQTVQLFQVIIM